MLFQAACKWWGDKGPRERPHEGLDLLLYRDRQGRILHLDEKSRIPVMGDGVVVSIIADFLGKSVIVEHAFPDRDTGRVYTIYGHTHPGSEIQVGTAVRRGEIIATVALPGRSAFVMVPHLHISIAWASKSIDRLNWDSIGASSSLILLDPLKAIDWQYRLLKDADPICRAL